MEYQKHMLNLNRDVNMFVWLYIKGTRKDIPKTHNPDQISRKVLLVNNLPPSIIPINRELTGPFYLITPSSRCNELMISMW